MRSRPDLVHPCDIFHEDPKTIVRFTLKHETSEDWVFGVYPHYSEREIEDGILNRACDIANCTCVNTDTLSKVEARIVDPRTARALAEYRYIPEELTFQQI